MSGATEVAGVDDASGGDGPPADAPVRNSPRGA
jgi:hypothetical protein